MLNKVAHKNMLGIYMQEAKAIACLLGNLGEFPCKCLKNQPPEIKFGVILANLQLEATMTALLGYIDGGA